MYYLDHVILFCYYSNFSLVLKFSNQYNFYFVSGYGNESETKENKIKTGLKIFKSKKNLNHIIFHNSCHTYTFICCNLKWLVKRKKL